MKITRRQLRMLVESVINANKSSYLDKLKILMDNDEFETAWFLGEQVMDDHPDIYEYFVDKSQYMARSPEHHEKVLAIIPVIKDNDPRLASICEALAESTLYYIDYIDKALELGKRNNDPYQFWESEVNYSDSQEVEIIDGLKGIGYISIDDDRYDMEYKGDYHELNVELMSEPIIKAANIYLMADLYEEAKDLLDRYDQEEAFDGLIPDVDQLWNEHYSI